jgi:hypothetical protein
MEDNIKQDIIEDAKADVQVPEQQPTASPGTPKKKCPCRWLLWALLIAALVAAVTVFGIKPAYLNYMSGQLISQNYAPWSYDDEDEDGMDRDDQMVDELSELFANVGSGKDIKLTIYRLEKALKNAFYDGDCAFFFDDIAWYLSLAYIQQNQFGSARTLLKSLKDDEDSPYAEQAEALYKQIENMFFM